MAEIVVQPLSQIEGIAPTALKAGHLRLDHLRQAGFSAEVIGASEINRVKVWLGVPSDLACCHTGKIEGYVIEGHVPAEAIERLLSEQPRAKELAVAGMPMGSPGVEMQGIVEI